MRQVILDTETTGLLPKEGHRIIEIGCIEMLDRRITGKRLHLYINPEREVEEGALAVHGISNTFLKDKPVFKDIVEEFIAFVEGAELIIHNAPFDVGFLDHELALCRRGYKKIHALCDVFDTLVLARKLHMGQRNSLDALCKRYDVDNSNRELHGALLDAELLARVYLAMTGGQNSLFSEENAVYNNQTQKEPPFVHDGSFALPVIKATDEEMAAHRAIVEKIKIQ